jgi:cytochrome c-type biogenesis protein
VELYQTILVPIAFGLLGFIEPCSIGANIIFLGYLESRGGGRILEAVKFTITRALFLGLIGLAVGIVGQSLRTGAYSYSLGLGMLYVALGLVGIFWRYRGKGLGSIDLGRYFPKEGAVPLGVIFGLSAPACSLPLFLALIGLGAIKGAWIGFLTLFLFGLALSAPLLWIARSERADKALRRLGKLAFRIPYLSESVLILVGGVTILISWKQLSVA